MGEQKETGVGSPAHGGAALLQGFVPSLIRGEAGGAAEGAVLALDLVVEDGLGRVVTGDPFEGQQGEPALLEGAEATFAFPLGLRARSHQMRNAQGREDALELGARTPPSVED